MQKLNYRLLMAMMIALATTLTLVPAAQAQVDDLTGKVVARVTTSASTTVKAGQWYLMQNRGRSAYNYENLSKTAVYQSAKGLEPGDDITAENAGFLFQFVAAPEGRSGDYYVMTGYGHWLCDITEDSQVVSVTDDESKRGMFTMGKCGASGHWWLKSAGGYVLDGNGSGNTAVGYGTTTPTKAGGNNDHALYAVTIGTADVLTGAALVNRKLKEGGIFRFASQRTTTMSMTDPSTHKLVSQTTQKDNEAQWWLLQPLKSGGVALRNYETGLFVQATSGGSAQYTTGAGRSTLYAKASPKASNTKALVTISSKENFADKSCLHDDASHKVVNWLANNANDENPCSDWNMTAVEDLPDASAIKDHFDEVGGFLCPSDGQTVLIRNVESGWQIGEDGSNRLLALEASTSDYAQYWVMERDEQGRYAFRNVQTGHYFIYTSGTGNGSTQNASATKKSYYTLTETDETWQRTYHISGSGEGGPYYTHTIPSNAPTGTPLPYVVNTTEGDASAQWVFVKTALTAEEIEEAQMAYKAYTDIKTNASTYTSKMNAYFTDASYSELNATYAGMTDEELRSKMAADGLPEYLVRIALKVKNNTWAEEDEMARDFRVNDYKVYTHYLYSKNLMSMGYAFGRLSNPTGIVVKQGDVLSVFCDKSAPSGCTLQLEVVDGTESGGTTYDLTKGINIFSFAEEGTVYVFYQSNDKDVKTPLANFPDVRIHFEGAHLNGYYDKTRGHTNATWKHLRDKMLKHSNVLNIKTDNLVFCFNNELTQKACPKDMELLLQEWDDMVETENELMGYNDTWLPGISKVQRNIYNFFSQSQYIGGLMMTALYGVQCMESSISSCMNAADMGAEGVWGPAHECGHLRQNLIQMLGTLESSNNLFSNVVVHKQGRNTHRGAAPQTVYDHFASHQPWVEHDIWETTHMLYQLYLYYHVCGFMPDFYPRVFDKMRRDPMNHSDRTNMHGGDEYLKVARAMCDVAQADLSELFDAYGFFEPVSGFQLYENGSNWGITTTQQEIDETLEYMHSFPKKLGNILFIEDRVEPVLATYPGHKEGETKKRRSDDPLGASASAGDVGQYTAYLEEPSLKNYYYSVTSAGKITVHGTGATGHVGFKVYDEDGRLACLANTFSFTLPTALRSQNYTLVAAMGDGSDIVLSTDLPEGISPLPAPHLGESPKSDKVRAYDLQGRVLKGQPQNGLFIMNGQKVVR